MAHQDDPSTPPYIPSPNLDRDSGYIGDIPTPGSFPSLEQFPSTPARVSREPVQADDPALVNDDESLGIAPPPALASSENQSQIEVDHVNAHFQSQFPQPFQLSEHRAVITSRPDMVKPLKYKGAGPAGYHIKYYLLQRHYSHPMMGVWLDIYDGYANLRTTYFRTALSIGLPAFLRIAQRHSAWCSLFSLMPDHIKLSFIAPYHDADTGVTVAPTTFCTQLGALHKYAQAVMNVLQRLQYEMMVFDRRSNRMMLVSRFRDAKREMKRDFRVILREVEKDRDGRSNAEHSHHSRRKVEYDLEEMEDIESGVKWIKEVGLMSESDDEKNQT